LTDNFSLLNPIVFSAVMVLMIFGSFVIMTKYGLVPNNLRHAAEKKQLEEEKEKYGKLFNEMAPIPIILLNNAGRIVYQNSEGKRIVQSIEAAKGSSFGGLILQILGEESFEQVIHKGAELQCEYKQGNTVYIIKLQGVQEHKFAYISLVDISDRTTLEREIQKFNERLQQSIERERRRLANELHDGHGQTLTSIRMLAERLQKKTAGMYDGELTEILREADQGIEEIYEMVNELKPKLLGELGLNTAVQSLVNRVAKTAELEGEFVSQIPDDYLTADEEMRIYRIIQELTNNIVKYSNAKHFGVQLICHEGMVNIIVSDDGKGMTEVHRNSKEGSGWGLFNIEHQIRQREGRFEVVTGKLSGTEILIEYPAETKEKNEAST